MSEVYLQSEETAELLHRGLDMIRPSNYVFVYNIGDCSDTRKLEGNPNIVRFSTMTQESGRSVSCFDWWTIVIGSIICYQSIVTSWERY